MDIKFVNYTGRYPNLCSGVLTLEIEGKKYTFGPAWKECDFPCFWTSGGSVWCNSESEGTTHAPWDSRYADHECNKIDEFFGEGAAEKFLDVMNENVDYGCYGGCI